jgi:hypothetical protein
MKIKGLRKVKEEELKEYKHHMETVTIPKIVETLKRRAVVAAKNKWRPLFG